MRLASLNVRVKLHDTRVVLTLHPGLVKMPPPGGQELAMSGLVFSRLLTAAEQGSFELGHLSARVLLISSRECESQRVCAPRFLESRHGRNWLGGDGRLAWSRRTHGSGR